MAKLILNRVISSIPLLFVVSIVTFVLEAIVPGNAARSIAGTSLPPAQYEALRVKLGLNLPLWKQYELWIERLLHGSLGTSLFTNQPVVTELNSRLPVTLVLVAGVFVVCTTIGVLLGTLSSIHEGRLGKALDALSMVGLSLPNFWVALVFISIFAISLKVLPATGYTYFTQSPMEWLKGIILPIAALALAPITIIAKQTRDAMLDALGGTYIRSLRACGISERSIIWKHALKNAAIPVVTIIGVVMIVTLSATVFIEAAFVLPGLGSLAVQATEQHDLPVIEGIALYFTLITVAVNLLVDVAYGWLNPKVRVS